MSIKCPTCYPKNKADLTLYDKTKLFWKCENCKSTFPDNYLSAFWSGHFKGTQKLFDLYKAVSIWLSADKESLENFALIPYSQGYYVGAVKRLEQVKATIEEAATE